MTEEKEESVEISHIRFLWTHRINVLNEFDKNGRKWPIYSALGYAYDSKDKNNPCNVMKANKYDMKTVPFDVIAVADTGQTVLMNRKEAVPYQFPGAKWIHLTSLQQQSPSLPKPVSPKQTSPKQYDRYLSVPPAKNTSPLYKSGKAIIGQ